MGESPYANASVHHLPNKPPFPPAGHGLQENIIGLVISSHRDTVRTIEIIMDHRFAVRPIAEKLIDKRNAGNAGEIGFKSGGDFDLSQDVAFVNQRRVDYPYAIIVFEPRVQFCLKFAHFFPLFFRLARFCFLACSLSLAAVPFILPSTSPRFLRVVPVSHRPFRPDLPQVAASRLNH